MRTRYPPANTFGGASSSSPPAGEHEALSSWINEVRKKVNDVGPEHHPLGPFTIFKIPRHIRRCDHDAYTPVVVTIGPFHYRLSRKTELKEMQGHKWRCVRYLLSRHDSKNQRELLDRCLLTLKALDEDVRSCYSKKFSVLNAQDMAELMLLDGCFIIHLLLKYACQERDEKKREIEGRKKKDIEEKKKKEIEEKKKREEEAALRVSVGKKEEVVLEVEEGGTRGEKASDAGMSVGKKEEVVCEVQEGTRGAKASDAGSGERVRRALSSSKEKMRGLEYFKTEHEKVELRINEHRKEIEGPLVEGLFTVKVVLYDLLKLENQIPFFIIQTLFDLLKTSHDDNINLPGRVLDLFSNIHPDVSKSFDTTTLQNPIHHLLHLFHSSRIFTPPREQQEYRTGPGWIPSATELRRAGVKFRRKKEETCFFDITFDNGRMEVPALQVSHDTRSLFRNLIAFEQCFADAKPYATIYAVFMDCIIDEPEDARYLHLKGIMVNRLSTDGNMADLFNELCNQIYYRPEGNYLLNLFANVDQYYRSRIRKWRADLKRDYFNSPWTIISVIAAVLLLLLTIEQSVFSGISYFHPEV